MPEALEMTCASGNQLAETSRCRVLESRAMGRFVLLRLQAPRIAACASPGQFVMVDVPDGDFHLRRPVSLFSVHDERITLLIEVRGVGTARLAQLAAGIAPTIAETLPGYDASGWWGYVAPAGTPKPIVDKLNRELNKIVQSADFKEHFKSQGVEMLGTTPDEFRTHVEREMETWRKLIKKANITMG